MRTHVDYDDPEYIERLPFQPFDQTLRAVLRRGYMTPVTQWLLGRNDTSLLAMEGNSAWETALTVTFLLQSAEILEEAQELPDLRAKIDAKVVSATRWLLDKRTPHDDGTFCWEHVTWDTSVIINALVEVLMKYKQHFSSHDQDDIESTIIGGMHWLYRQFSQWESKVKYPFGPADVGQIANTVLLLQDVYPQLYEKMENSFEGGPGYNLPYQIVHYLLQRRTRRRLIITDENGTVEAHGCWWDDYFSSAEVIETLARFHHAAETRSIPQWKEILGDVKVCLIEACAFLESTQLDGMWGNHIDTIRILSAYVMTRRLLPQHAEGRSDPTIQPEIHITFKALRWICDEKQIFDDGSFLHTLFLSVFYAEVLVEVYRSWEPASSTIEKLYDDVVWASPVRTTPERTKRLAADISNDRLREELNATKHLVAEYTNQVTISRQTTRKLVISAVTASSLAIVGFVSALMLRTADITFRVLDTVAFLTLIALLVSVIAIIVGLVWKYDDLTWFAEKPVRKQTAEDLVGGPKQDTLLEVPRREGAKSERGVVLALDGVRDAIRPHDHELSVHMTTS